jgi:class 3 adenylate cyclase
MVDLIERIEGVVLSARWSNWTTAMSPSMNTEELVELAKTFLNGVEGAVRAKEGEVKHSLPDRVAAFFPVIGRITDTETRAIECARRIVMEFRRYNAKQPPVRMDVTIALASGPVVIAPGIAEVNLNALVLGEPLAAADRMLMVGKPDTVLVSEATYTRIGVMYKGRPLDGQTPKIFELIL